MKNTSILEQNVSWQDFATIKAWQKSLKKHSKKKELSKGTWDLAEIYFSGFLKTCKMNPDELIEEALINPEMGEEKIDDYFQILKETLAYNSARSICYGLIQGFYSHNKVITKRWTAPEPKPSKVKDTDDNFPVWIYNEETEDFDLNRKLFQDFFNRLSPTYRAIAYAMIGTGQDIGIILQKNIEFVKNQDYKHKRLSLNDARSKTSEIIDGFYSVEATDAARNIIAAERFNAQEDEPLYATSIAQRKREFKNLHQREFRNDGIDILPPARRLNVGIVEHAFRNAQRKMGIKWNKGQQSPLRPKRLRKIFRTAADLAGLGDDKARQLLGQSNGRKSSGVYLETAREIQEHQYMKVEKRIWIFKEPELSAKEKQDVKDLRKQLEIEKQSNYDMRKTFNEKFVEYDKTIKEKFEIERKYREALTKPLDDDAITKKIEEILKKNKQI